MYVLAFPHCLEPHSKRLKVRVTVRKEVLNKVMLQQEAVVEVGSIIYGNLKDENGLLRMTGARTKGKAFRVMVCSI